MKKIAALILSGILTCTALSGCASQTAPQSSSPAGSAASNAASSGTASSTADKAEEANLRLMWWGSQVRHDGTVAVAKSYTDQHPNVKIQTEFMGFGDYFQKLNTLVAANDAPDIMQMGNAFLTYEKKLEPLDSYVEKGLLDLSDTSESFLMPTTLNGKLLGVSLGTTAFSMVYDPELFQQAGVAEPTENWTWDEFEQACKQVNDKLGIYGTGALSDFWGGCSVYVGQHGDSLDVYNQDGTALGYTDDSMLADYFRMKQRLMEHGTTYPTPDVIASIKDIQGDLIVQKKSAISWVNINQYVSLATAAARPLKVIPYPKLTADGPSGMSIRSSMAFSMSSESKYKDEAAKFISYFVNDLDANSILQGERGVSIMSKVRDHLSQGADPLVKETYDYIDLVGKIASQKQPVEPTGQMEIEDISKRVNEELAFGKTTPDEAAAKFRKEATAILEKK